MMPDRPRKYAVQRYTLSQDYEYAMAMMERDGWIIHTAQFSEDLRTLAVLWQYSPEDR